MTSAVYVNMTSPLVYWALPFPLTVTTTRWSPTGPLPTLHVTLVGVAAVTVQATPPIVTVFSDWTLLNPLPEMTIEVDRAEVPEISKIVLF